MHRIQGRYEEGRIAYFDNLKFILITLVVLGHAIDPFRNVFPVYARLYFFIYIFHMPLFMFVTGIFSRRALGYDLAPGELPERRTGIARAASFIVLYLMLNFSIFIVERLGAGRDVVFNPLSVRNASWYFLACGILTFVCALTGGAGRRLGVRRKALVIALVALAAVVIGYFDSFDDFLALSRVICFAPFFLAGLYIGPERLAGVHRRTYAAGNGRIWLPCGKTMTIFAMSVLVAVGVTIFLMPEQWLVVRGILSARNPYYRFADLASYGPVMRLMWYAIASALSFCVMVIVPARAMFYTRLGSNTISIYIWHLLLLRLLGTTASVPFMAHIVAGADMSVRPVMSLIPVGLSIATVFLFSLKPPFGVLAGKIMRTIGRPVKFQAEKLRNL